MYGAHIFHTSNKEVWDYMNSFVEFNRYTNSPVAVYKDELIVFVEVKTRSMLDFGNPEDFVNKNKQRAYIRLANAYVIENDREEEVRFDIIAVEISQTSYQINHIEDAFSAVGQWN